jgi:antitoxin (DNA-binding transcriptional repressor) of toxin-antitoxin stability system
MLQINIHEAKTQLSRLIAEGREVVIARYGQPVAKLVPLKPMEKDRVPGTARDKVKMKKDFFDPLPDDILDGFYK